MSLVVPADFLFHPMGHNLTGSLVQLWFEPLDEVGVGGKRGGDKSVPVDDMHDTKMCLYC